MFLVFHFFVVIPGHNLGNSQVSVSRTIGPTLVKKCLETRKILPVTSVLSTETSDRKCSN